MSVVRLAAFLMQPFIGLFVDDDASQSFAVSWIKFIPDFMLHGGARRMHSLFLFSGHLAGLANDGPHIPPHDRLLLDWSVPAYPYCTRALYDASEHDTYEGGHIRMWSS